MIHTLAIETSKRTQLINITARIDHLLKQYDCKSGLCHLYVPHTSASVLINEGYDPDVVRDMEVALDRLVPPEGDYRHGEGNSDSHIKVALLGTSQSIFVESGKLMLGRWQAIFFAEFDGPRHREIHVKIAPDHSKS